MTSAQRWCCGVTNIGYGATIPSRNADCRIAAVGGVLRRANGGSIGDPTIAAIRRFEFDIAVIGSSALDRDGDLPDFDMQEVRVTRAIFDQVRRVHPVADRSTFQRKAPVRAAQVDGADRPRGAV